MPDGCHWNLFTLLAIFASKSWEQNNCSFGDYAVPLPFLAKFPAGTLERFVPSSVYMTHPTPLPIWCECRVWFGRCSACGYRDKISPKTAFVSVLKAVAFVYNCASVVERMLTAQIATLMLAMLSTSLKPGDADMRLPIGSSLLQLMVYRLCDKLDWICQVGFPGDCRWPATGDSDAYCDVFYVCACVCVRVWKVVQTLYVWWKLV